MYVDAKFDAMLRVNYAQAIFWASQVDVHSEISTNRTSQPEMSHPIPTVYKHYKRRKILSALPDRKYSAPPSQAGLVLQAVLDYNGDGRGNLCWHPETGIHQCPLAKCIIVRQFFFTSYADRSVRCNRKLMASVRSIIQ